MNFRSKVFGVVAAAVMTVSLFGAAAADSDVPVNVNLGPNECSVTATTSEITLGPFEYNGKDGYDLVGKNGQSIQLDVTVPGPGESCATSFSLENGVLTHEGGTATISGSHMGIKPGRHGDGNYYGGPGAKLDVGGTWNLLSDTSHAYTTMTTVPDDVKTGNYTGTIQIALVVATP